MRSSVRTLRFALAILVGVAAVGGTVVVACGPSGFTDDNVIASVRILASRSDQPYANPGPTGVTVRSQVLAVDGRPDASGNEPMRVFWLPFVCINPPNDAFYACFAEFAANGSSVQQYGAAGVNGQASTTGTSATISGAISAWDGGPEAGVSPGPGLALGDGGVALEGGLAAIPAGTDISAFLVQGARAVFHLPTDIVSAHAPVSGATPYGLAIVFNIACAGHVELIALDPNNQDPEQIPFGCFNSQHQLLTANDYVIGYTEVFAYTKLTNKNPVISSFSFRGHSLSIDGGVTAPLSIAPCAANAKNCPDGSTIVGVPDASWEPDPQDPGPDGGSLGEQIWVDYYSNVGSLNDDAILIFDPVEGRVVPPHQESFQTSGSGSGTMWAVVHDNRGGASWITVPIHSQ